MVDRLHAPRLLSAIVVGLGLLTSAAPVAQAQPATPVGVRAAGMGGAFTAVADGATATYWNPAGLASGPFVGLTLDVNVADPGAGGFVGLATPPFGVSYFREKVAGTFQGKVPATSTSTGGDPNDRNADLVNSAATSVVNPVVHHLGATIVQSIGDHGLTVGATLGAVHGNGATAFDADAGVMLAGVLGRVGLTVHNVTAPSLGDLRLDRRVRAGLAIHARQDLTIATDIELTTTTVASGDWREAAVGLEAHPAPRLWLRGGTHWNTAGGSDAAPIGTAGGSYAVYGAFRVDGQVSFGSKEGNRGWGVGLSFAY